jgi:poly(A) polymerase
LQEQEALDAIRPDLDGNEIMRILDIPPGPAVGQAWQFLKDLRMELGPLDHDRAVEELKRWWTQQSR